MNFSEIKSIIAERAAELGIAEYEIYYMSSDDTTVETLNREINGFSSGTRGGICLRVVASGKLGYAATELIEKNEIAMLPERAKDNAKYVEKPDTVGIFEGSASYEEQRVPEHNPMSARELKEYAKLVADKLFSESDKVVNGTASRAVATGFEIRIANSHGLDLSTSCGINAALAEAVVSVGDEMQSAYSIEELKRDNVEGSVDKMVSRTVKDALNKIGAKSVESGKYNVLFDGKQMRALLSVFSSAFSARQVLDGMSMLKGKLGEAVASDVVTVTDDPQREGLSIGTTFDAEGVATHRKAVIESGILKTYLHNRETALAMGTESTANASKGDYSSPVSIMPHSFCIEAGEKSFDELLALTGDGIYVTELQGLHAGANPITGDFSLQSAGFMIRGGKICEAVKSFTVAGNFFTLLKGIEALSDKIELATPTGFTGFGAPAALVRDMSVSGK